MAPQLNVCCLAGYTEIVRLLLAQGADINMPRKLFGVTALMLAAANHQVGIVQTLVEAGAQVAKNDDGRYSADGGSLKR